MSKRSRDDTMIDELAAEIAQNIIKRIKKNNEEGLGGTKDKQSIQEPTIFNTKITTQKDAEIQRNIYDTVGEIIKDGVLTQKDDEGVREYSFIVQYPNEIDDLQLSTLKTLCDFACIIISESKSAREFVVSMFFTLNQRMRSTIVQRYMHINQEATNVTGDTAVDCILQRINSCISRDKADQRETKIVLRERLAGMEMTCLSAKLNKTVAYDAVLGIRALSMVTRISFAASVESTFPVIKIQFTVAVPEKV